MEERRIVSRKQTLAQIYKATRLFGSRFGWKAGLSEMLRATWHFLIPDWLQRYWWMLCTLIISLAFLVILWAASLYWLPIQYVPSAERIGLAQLLVESTAVLLGAVGGAVALHELRERFARPRPRIQFRDETGHLVSSLILRIGDRSCHSWPLKIWNRSNLIARALKVQLIFWQTSDLLFGIKGDHWAEERGKDSVTWTWRSKTNFVLHAHDMEDTGEIWVRRPDIAEVIKDPQVLFPAYVVRIDAYIHHETGTELQGLGIWILPP
jgi:hypothetical protein